MKSFVCLNTTSSRMPSAGANPRQKAVRRSLRTMSIADDPLELSNLAATTQVIVKSQSLLYLTEASFDCS